MSDRHHPHVVVRHNVCCQSDRHGVKPQLIVLHDTEGANLPKTARDLIGLGEFFDRLSTQASSHVAVDEDGQSARYVSDVRKAWSQAFYNSVGLSIEQIGFARQDWTAKGKLPQLEETSRWVAWWSKQHGIPIQRGRVSKDGQVLKPGVIQHRQLGSLGGGHVDVSPTYPTTLVLKMAREHARHL